MNDLIAASGRFVLDLGVYLINGVLVLFYTLADHLPLLVALASALILGLVFDPEAQRLMATRPGRPGQPAPERPQRGYQALTALTGGLWLAAALLFPSPVPWLGGVMWVGSLLALLVLPAERPPMLWRVKVSLLGYALALIGFRLYLGAALAASPQDWAGVVGSVGEAERVLAGNRGLFLTLGTWAAWFVIPAGHATYIVQRLTVNAMSLVNPFQSATQIVRDIRTRGLDG